jgi:hypothetical protein
VADLAGRDHRSAVCRPGVLTVIILEVSTAAVPRPDRAGAQEATAAVPAPSAKRIAVATLIAFATAALILVAVVLPAEYGKDPLGTGKALGLLAIYEAGVEDAPAASPPPAASESRSLKLDSSTLTLEAGAAFEYKYRLAQGASMVYSWRTDAAVKFEFHGEPDDRRLAVVTYDKRQGDRAFGTLTAAFSGIHGWYWENPTDRRLTITIDSAGFFTEAEELRPVFDPVKHKQRIEHVPHVLSDPRDEARLKN